MQALGFCFPNTVGLTCLQCEVMGPCGPLYLRSMSETTTFWQGSPLLHTSLTARGVEEVPLIFLKLTLLILTLDGIWALHWFQGQYSWSIKIGLPTFSIVMSSKCKSEAVPGCESGQVLIRTPFWVFLRVQPLIFTPWTGSSFGYFPRLPMLNPWPGPHETLLMEIFLLPSPIDTQSSPVWMSELIILILVERPMWIPSVLRLFSSAMTLTCWKVKFVQPNTFTWNCLLFRDVTSRTTEFLTKLNLIFFFFFSTK